MKISIPRPAHSSRSILATLVSAGLLVFPVTAAETSTPQPTVAPEAEAPKASDTQNLKIESTNLGEMIFGLRKLYPEANFVVTEDAQSVMVAQLDLRNVTVREALDAICLATGSAVEWREGDETNRRRGSTPMYVLSETPKPKAKVSKPELETRAYYLGKYLGEFPQDKATDAMRGDDAYKLDQLRSLIMSTIQTYSEMEKASGGTGTEQPRIDFHEGARTLVVLGSPAAVKITDQIIASLPAAPTPPSE